MKSSKKSKYESTLKSLDGWTEVFIIDPPTSIISKFLAKINFIHPLHLTALSIISGLFAAYNLFNGNVFFAGILFFLSIFFDGMDGKIARRRKKSIILHGAFDVTLDQVRNISMIFALTMHFPQYNLFFLLFLSMVFLYEVTLVLRTDIRYRFMNRNWNSMQEVKDNYEEEIQNMKTPFLQLLLNIYNFLFSKTRKLRTYPYSTVVDAEFMLFVVFTLTGNFYILILSILFLLPDLLISILLTGIFALKFSNKILQE